MRLGKTRIVIEAAARLFEQGVIDRMVVVCPPNVRSVWADPSPALGEVAKWWPSHLPYTVREYRSDKALMGWPLGMQIVVTNPEFIRRGRRLEPLKTWAADGRTMLVGDESWQWKNPTAAQTKAMRQLRSVCQRVVLLNGTPGPMKDLYSQFAILDPTILPVKNWWQFQARYAIKGGWEQRQIVGYQRVEEFQALTRPYAVTRLTEDCRDVGPTPVRTQIEVPLTPATWRVYKAMEAELVAWLETNEAATASSAGVKMLRLAQITNGFIGGVDSTLGTTVPNSGSREIGQEKLQALLSWLEGNDTDRFVIFTRFRDDVKRTAETMQARGLATATLYGASDDDERRYAKLLMSPTEGPKAGCVVANAQSGGIGLDFTGADLCIFLANDFSLKNRQQAEARIDGPAQTRRRRYLDLLATGPNGETTIDHHIVRALRSAEDVATWTAETWRHKLKEA